MRTYGDVVDDLARSVAWLISTPLQESPPADCVLVARDAVLDGLTHLVDAITGAGGRPPPRPLAGDSEIDPLRALRSALHHLPRTSRRAGLVDAVAEGDLPEPWRIAAASALELGRYEEPLRHLDATAARTALRDAADIAATFMRVDEDLAYTATSTHHLGRHTRAALRLAARAVIETGSREPEDRTAMTLGEPVPVQALAIRRAADIPEAVRRIGAMVRARDARVTMHEIGVVVSALAHSLDDAQRILRVTAWRLPTSEPLLELAEHATRSAAALSGVSRHRGTIATIGASDHALVGQALELPHAMRAVLNYNGTADGRENLGPPRVARAAIEEASQVIVNLRHSFESAARCGGLYVSVDGISINRREWTRGRPDDVRIQAMADDFGAAAGAMQVPAELRSRSEATLGLTTTIVPARTQSFRGRRATISALRTTPLSTATSDPGGMQAPGS